jgi:GT2 family glycosyltransferase
LRTPHNLGFAGNLNWAAQYAEGEYLLLLNQDTRSVPVGSDAPIVAKLLRPGWVDAMLDVFAQYPDAGLVGPRLVFPNGMIQSVGGEFGADKGPAHRYIGWANPLDRRVSKTERVSWITGAAIMLRREDFFTLGGLRGDIYIKGYFEDVDACMRMRFELGKEVYYCADATLVHEAGSTGGNPQFFMRNSATFHRLWDNKIEVENAFIAVGY